MTFREQPEFMRVRDALFHDDDNFRLFQNALMAHPDSGDVIPGGGGIRKVRWADPARGKGKRGGIRVIYYHVPEYSEILLIFAYDKNTSDISAEERKLFRTAAQNFRQELDKEKEKR